MNKTFFLTFIFVLVIINLAFAAGWYTDSTNNTLVWPYRQKITISGASVEATLTNFPVLIKITDTTNTVFTKAQSTGNDILFTSSDGTTKLNHEIEFFGTGSHASMEAWVNIPTLTGGSDTIIYMYYGSSTASDQSNKTAVWDSNYKGVWHMNNDPSNHGVGAIKDSTSNANNGTTEASMFSTDEVFGQIGPAIHFDGSNDFITVPMSLLQSTPECVEVWFKTTTTAVLQHIIWAGDVAGNGWGPNPEFHLSIGNSVWGTLTNEVCGYSGDANNLPQTTGNFLNVSTQGGAFTDTANFHHLVLTTTGTLGTFYLDGVLVSSDSSAVIDKVTTWTAGTYIGRSGAGPRCFSGILDEIRISNSTRAPEWIRTEYKNQGSPSSFCTFSAQEYRPSATLISNYIDDPRKNYAYLRRRPLSKPQFL